MGEYVRRVKTGSGATAVQIVAKTRGVRSIIEHVGSAHTELELELMGLFVIEGVDAVPGVATRKQIEAFR